MAEAAVLLALLQAVTQALTEGALKALISFNHHIPDLHDAKRYLENIKGELESIKPVLDFVDSMDNDTKKEVNQDMVVFANQLREKAYKLEDSLDELMNLIHHYNAGGLHGHAHNARAAMFLSSDPFAARRIVKEIQQIDSELNKITERRKRYKITYPNVVLAGTSSNGGDGGNAPCLHYRRFDERGDLVGIEENEKLVLNWLMDGEINLNLLSIFGMGGVGKTTLTSAIYDHPKVKRHFEFRAWVPISQSWNLSELLLFIAKKLTDDKGKGIDSGSELIARSLTKRRYLIVLDDVWDDEIINRFTSILPNNNLRSRVIITSRTHNLKSNLPTKSLELKALKEKEAMGLFFKIVFGNSQCPEELVVWGENFVRKCEGLPLGIVAIGRVLASQSATLREWERMYNSLQWELTNNEHLKPMQGVLMLSYYKLPNYLKRCFVYCALFPEDYAIKKKMLVHMWIAEGFIEEDLIQGRTLEELGERYVDMLVDKSMLQVVKKKETGKPKSCKVHDLMRELALAIAKEENLYMKKDGPLDIKNKFRRLSIYGKIVGVTPKNQNFPELRTLLVFNGNRSLVQSLSYIYPNLKLLRVLNLQGLPIDNIPDEIFDLFNLRFLSLRDTKIKEVSKHIGDLYNLQTLDLWKTNVKYLPRKVLRLGNLRHLLVQELDACELKFKNPCKFRGANAPINIGALKQLQTLRSIQAHEDTLTHLQTMTQLKSLCITSLDRNNSTELCQSVSRMTGLVRLSIKAAKHGILILDNTSSPPYHLQKLILNGNLATVPRWFVSLHSLTQLYLIGSQLREGENPITYIQSLRNLVRLALDEAYMGRILVFPKESFQSLKTLYLANMNMLVKVVIEKRAMPVLSRFHVISCKHLNEIEGTEMLTNVIDLKMKMLPQFHRRMIQNLS